MRVIKTLGISLLIIFSIVACEELSLPDIRLCVPNFGFKVARCGLYSLKKLRFISKLEDKAITNVNNWACIHIEDFRAKMVPAIQKYYNIQADKKKKLEVGPEAKIKKMWDASQY